jgi:tetratricopeptide (TPR) repeat protein
LPDPQFVAALGDLYRLAGRDEDAKKQYELVEQIGRLSATSGALYNRQLALFYADHDIKTEEAYKLAAKEYEARRDIYGADALAWTALKAGKLNEAQTAMKDALRLGTQDAKLFYHAGMIARASGDETAAREFIKRALELNPQFDPRQSVIAKTLLENR